MVQQITMEREELERAKVSIAPYLATDSAVIPRDTHAIPHPHVQSALLEEQRSVMHKCGEERRRLAAEWADFFSQQKLSKERAEREAERTLQVDTQREGTLISLAKVGPRASGTAEGLEALAFHLDASAPRLGT
jgi:Fas-binding factor 1